jgi:hypothetical protein
MNGSKLQIFIYLLTRDELSFGRIEKHLAECEKFPDKEVVFSEPQMAAYAASIEARLIGELNIQPSPWMFIWQDHDSTKAAIGRMRQLGQRIEVQLFNPLTREQIFNIFGNAGMMATKHLISADGQIQLISNFTIFEFSLCAEAAEPSTTKE